MTILLRLAVTKDGMRNFRMTKSPIPDPILSSASQIFGIARPMLVAQSFTIVSSKKNREKATIPTTTERSGGVRVIRLLPSSSDYECFVNTTALAMGRTVTPASRHKPNTRLLSLLNLGA